MKTTAYFIVFTCLLSLASQAQSLAPARIHFLNTMVGLNAELRMGTDGPKQSIVIKARHWITVQVKGDSLGFLVDDKTYFLHFEPNRQYYFIIHKAHDSRPVITEKSEREFILTASAESVKGPEEFTVDKVTN
ncbi:hypothetical protein WBJ53_12215 [Spirosoma sp. SC4-14]|uniref:hypothetical protein n=1 Tax=Spirosoma sp. SC4-14 TaxID=3128900 RepID=UPI0030D23DC7